MTDPRIEIAARAIWEDRYSEPWELAKNFAENGEGNGRYLTIMGHARAVLIALDAAQPEVEVYAARLFDELLAAQSRFAAAWRDDTELSPSQLRDEQIRDEARRKLRLNMAARPEVEIYGTFGDGSRQVIRTGANSVPITSKTAGDIILELQDALTAARAPAAPDRRAERQARIEAAISACTECGGREFPKRSDCDGCTAAVDEAMEEERSAPAALDAWQPIETAPSGGCAIVSNGIIVGEAYLFRSGEQWEWLSGNAVDPAPTHWQPLPKPPIEAAKDAKP